MKQNRFLFTYILLLIGQILLCNYFHITHLMMISILPAMILCIPTKHNTTIALLVAFATGLAVDMLAEGVIGLNVLALVPVAFARQNVVRAVFGDEIFTRGESFSFKRNGPGKVAFAIIMVQALFLLVYIWADGAGSRPLWFNAARFGLSFVASVLLSMFVVDLMSPDDRD